MKREIVILIDAISQGRTDVGSVTLRISGTDRPIKMNVGDTITLYVPDDIPRDPNANHFTAEILS